MKYEYTARKALLLDGAITWTGEITTTDNDWVAIVTTKGSELLSVAFHDPFAEEQFQLDAEDAFPDLSTQDATAALINQVRNG